MPKTYYIPEFNETKTLGGWARDPRCQVDYWTLQKRFRSGRLSLYEAVTSPSRNAQGEPLPRPVKPFAKRDYPTFNEFARQRRSPSRSGRR